LPPEQQSSVWLQDDSRASTESTMNVFMTASP
jgi:hypothetical protein